MAEAALDGRADGDGGSASLIVVGIDRLVPASTLSEQLSAFLSDIDFHRTLMQGMLSFLLFAGALHVDWSQMRKGRLPILVFSTVGVLISTVIVGLDQGCHPDPRRGSL